MIMFQIHAQVTEKTCLFHGLGGSKESMFNQSEKFQHIMHRIISVATAAYDLKFRLHRFQVSNYAS